MNSYFDRLNLEMIALESAIGAFEVENDITDEYLRDYSDYETPAYESAESSDSFGFDLFDDMYSPATEEADEASTTKGGKLSQGIKNILSNIGKLFTKIKDGIVGLFTGLKKKKAEVKEDKVMNSVSPAAIELADNIRGAIKQAYNIIGNITTTDSRYIEGICQKISAALKSAGGASKLLSAHSGKSNYENATSGADAMADAGKAFRGNYSGSDEESSRKAVKDLEEANALLAKVEATSADLDAALDNVHKIFEKEFTAAYNKLNSKSNNNADYTVREEESDLARARREDEENDKKRDEENENAEALKKFNDRVQRRTDAGVLKGASKAKKVESIPMATLVNQVRQVVFVKYTMTDVTAAVDAVIKACDGNKDTCDKLVSLAPANVSGDAKIAYDMCKTLSKASAIYTHISGSIQRLVGGEVFKVELSNGDKSKSTTYGSHGQFRTTSSNQYDDKNKANKRYFNS